jgi:hypothetical protein
MATSGPTTAGQPYRLKIGGSRWVSPTISFNNQKSTFNIQHSSIGNSSTYHADGDKWADRGGSALPF